MEKKADTSDDDQDDDATEGEGSDNADEPFDEGESEQVARSSHESDAKPGFSRSGSFAAASVKSAKSSYTSPMAKTAVTRLGSSEFEKSSPGDDGLNVPDGQLTDPQRLTKYVLKLDLLDAMGGSKMGNQRHHALACIEKMQPTWASQLKGHVRLFDWAIALSPGKIAGTSMSDLKEAIEGLQDKVTAFPCPVLTELWRRSAKELVAKCTLEPFGEDAFAALWAHVRTYLLEEKEAESTKKPQTLQPPLSSIPLPVAERCSLFSAVILNQVLIPVLMAGAAKEKMMIGVLKSMTAKCRNDLELDLQDEEVSILADLQDFAAGVLAVMAGNPLGPCFAGRSWRQSRRFEKSSGHLAKKPSQYFPTVWHCHSRVSTWRRTHPLLLWLLHFEFTKAELRGF